MKINLRLAVASAILAVIFVACNVPSALAQFPCGCNGWQPTGEIAMQGFNPAWDITEPDTIYLTVSVPEEAVVEVNGDPTAMVGATRYFVIRHLDPERDYKFVISAVTLNPAGIPLEEKKTLVLGAGSRDSVSLAPYKRKVEEEEIAEDDVPAEDAPVAQEDTPELPEQTG